MAIVIGFVLGFFASILANVFCSGFMHLICSFNPTRKLLYWVSVFNTNHKKIHKCSLIERVNKEEFSGMSSDLVSLKLGKRTKDGTISPRLDLLDNNKYVIFNTWEPFTFYDDIKEELGINALYLFENFENNVKSKQYVLAKENMSEIISIFEKENIRKYRHLKEINKYFRNKYRIQFYDFNPQDTSSEFFKNNSLYHFIFFKELVNKHVECFWTSSKNDSGFIGINGIIINNKYLLDYDSYSASLFFARRAFDKFNQAEEQRESYYNEYINLISPPNIQNPKLINLDRMGKILYRIDYEKYYA